jgi:uncharacterized repeat protein (TIGR03803 family)
MKVTNLRSLIKQVLLLTAIILLAGTHPVFAQETVIHDFQGSTVDGGLPVSGLVSDAAGNLYGTTFGGGDVRCSIYGCGTVFELSAKTGGGWTENILYNFTGYIHDGTGAFPEGGLIFDTAGNLYGTTSSGSHGGCNSGHGCGTVFELLPQSGGGWTATVLHYFAGNGEDGNDATGSLVMDSGGNLYGTTVLGGSREGGTVFELTPKSGRWIEKIIYSFENEGQGGSRPYGGLILDASGNLYGTTTDGGSSSCTGGCGTIFELSPQSGGNWTETVLHNFRNNGQDGRFPEASLRFDANGNLYGTTVAGGGAGDGIVFELSPQSGGKWTERVLHSFQDNGLDGYAPAAGLIFDGTGSLYGTTTYGGHSACNHGSGCGTVFKLKPKPGGGWKETVVHSFMDNATNGYYPYAGLLFDGSGNLYGTTINGGTGTACPRQCGTVFEIVAQ